MRRARGFTLVELLVVMGIMLILSGMVCSLVRLGTRKARDAGTEALLKQIDLALRQYGSEYRDYPPDGYDREPLWDAAGAYAGTLPAKPGIHLGKHVYFGSGCLIYFLCHPGTSGRTYLTLPLERYSAYEWDKTFDPAISPKSPAFKPEWATCEIVDLSLRPIHYDKVGDAADAIHFQADRFVGVRGFEAHSDQRFLVETVLPTLDAGDAAIHLDPRVSPGGGPRNPGSADLWSHGATWGDGLQGNWNW